MSIAQATDAADVSKQIVGDWFTKGRIFCSLSEIMLRKMVDTEEKPIQIDESYFSAAINITKGG